MVPYEFDAERFSRWMAYVLRHNPERYGLQPDRHGFVDLQEFVQIAKHRYPDLSPDRVREFVAATGGARFEIAGGQLRARYGHSIAVEPVGEPVVPPPQLYYGTESSRVPAILSVGLSPVDRRVVHLSVSADEAAAIARKKTEQAAVFRVDAQAASQAGIAFYKESSLYLVSHIPARFLAVEQIPASLTSPPAA